MESYSALFQETDIGTLPLKNKIIKAPQLTHLASPDGAVNSRLLNHYSKLARGGSGLVIVEYTYIDRDASQSTHCQLSAAGDDKSAGLSQLASTIQQGGARAGLQLAHCGIQKFLAAASFEYDPDEFPIKSASEVAWEDIREMIGDQAVAERLTKSEIQEVVDHYAVAAQRAQLAGFDMVEIHGAHGYLITNFLSPRTNNRTDEYGGSPENRARFLVEVLEAVTDALGEDFPLQIRLSGSDYEEGGITVEDTIRVLDMIEDRGVDSVHVSGGNHDQMLYQVTPMQLPHSIHADISARIKEQTGLTVVLSGSINTPERAENLLRKNHADLLSFGRPLLADPAWPRKIKRGDRDAIRPCIRCNDGCLDRTVYWGKTVQCSVNPGLGTGQREADLLEPGPGDKRVLVVGGGVAGMKAAQTCARRGFEVVLYEKDELGGQLNLLEELNHKSDLLLLRNHLASSLRMEPEIRIEETEFDASILDEVTPDAVVVATGTSTEHPDGVPRDDSVYSYLQILREQIRPGDRVGLLGGSVRALDTAMYLCQRGVEAVELVCGEEQVLAGAGVSEQKAYNKMLGKDEFGAINVYANTELVSYREGSLVLNSNGRSTEKTVDALVHARDHRPNTELSDTIRGQFEGSVVLAGDCERAGGIHEAIHGGFNRSNHLF